MKMVLFLTTLALTAGCAQVPTNTSTAVKTPDLSGPPLKISLSQTVQVSPDQIKGGSYQTMQRFGRGGIGVGRFSRGVGSRFFGDRFSRFGFRNRFFGFGGLYYPLYGYGANYYPDYYDPYRYAAGAYTPYYASPLYGYPSFSAGCCGGAAAAIAPYAYGSYGYGGYGGYAPYGGCCGGGALGGAFYGGRFAY